ncbi:mitochondrial ATP synthase g subunit-domain-containing protein [Spinellus fusiger]|nr:mitochondrial ATP synthase g subunit-domain-containing protein [Spinellus fusiger]
MSAKIASAFQCTLSKWTAIQKPILYNAKVAGEIVKQVYTKEGMAFPTGQQWAEAQASLKKINMACVKNLTVRDFAKGGIVAAEFYTFYLVGEIIGRRNLVGYNVPTVQHHHE